eukprot:s5893_g5.t1
MHQVLLVGFGAVCKDLRNLHKDVREVLEVHRGSGQAPVFPDRNKPDQEMADMHKSIAESLQTACQDILQKHMEQYCQGVQRHSSQKEGMIFLLGNARRRTTSIPMMRSVYLTIA